MTRQVLATGPKEELTSIDFSVDGETLYLGSVQARLSAWRWREPGAPVELGRPAGGLVRVVASPSGRVLAVGAGSRQNGRPDGVVTLHDAETGALLRSLPESGGFAAFSPDGAWLATGSWKGKVTLWNADDGSVVATFGGLNFVTSLRFSGDSRRLVVSRAEGACQIVDVATGMRRSGTPGYVSEVWDAALSPGGDRLATVSLDQSVRVWDAESGAERARFLGHERGVGQVAWAPEGQILATGGADGMVRLWSPAKNDPSVVGFPGKIGRMAFSRDGRHFVLQEQPGRVAVYRRADGMRLGEAAAGEALGILPAVDSLVCAARGGEAGEPWKIHFWSVPALVREKTMDLPGTEAEFHHLQVSPDGRWIAGYSDSGRARVWDLAAGARLIEVTEQIPHPVVAMALLTDPPRLIAAASQHPYLWLFSLPDGVAGGTMDYPGGAPNWLLPSRDGESLFVSSTDGTMRKWDVVDRKSQWQFAVKPGVLALSPDGLTLACATPGAVRLWNVETRREVARFSAKPVVHTVAFSPDGRALLFSESDPGQAPVTRMLMAPDIGQTESRPE